MDAAVEAGINFFDTADVYGGPQRPDMDQGYGLSEEIIGRWLSQGGRRDRIVLATKVYQPMGLGRNDKYLSAHHIRRACEASLRRLQTDHVDLYQMHHVDRATPWEDTAWTSSSGVSWKNTASATWSRCPRANGSAPTGTGIAPTPPPPRLPPRRGSAAPAAAAPKANGCMTWHRGRCVSRSSPAISVGCWPGAA
ncbi:aldo/keto reductase [Nonomuraea sp. NPDC049655]|uniref:aldo/keto reductase n=1 Tax=Nonomuraea sp. NPDC049655 TaxID=3364355 RepID=UPI0037A315FB